MDLIQFELKINRDWHFRSAKLKAVVTAINRFTQARDQPALDEVTSAYTRWKNSEPQEFKKRGAPIDAEMQAAFLHAPGQYFRKMITVVDPQSHPVWEPREWKGNILDSTNCYAYACDDRYGHTGNTKQDPGDYYEKYKADNDTYSLVEANPRDPIENRAINEAAVLSGVQADNKIRSRRGESVLTECDGEVRNKRDHYLIALVVAGADYHWYRQDSTGYWSEKRGGGEPSNTHNFGLIYDPRTIPDDISTPPRFFHVPKGGAPTHSSDGKFLSEARGRMHFPAQNVPGTPSFTGLAALYEQGDDVDLSGDHPSVAIGPISPPI